MQPAIDADGDGRVDAVDFRAYLDWHKAEPIKYGAEIVEISGATLTCAGAVNTGINGAYQRLGKVANGRAVYTKLLSSQPMALWWANIDGVLCWVIGRQGDVGTSKMCAYVKCMGAGPEESSGGTWQVYSYDRKSYEAQLTMAVRQSDASQLGGPKGEITDSEEEEDDAGEDPEDEAGGEDLRVSRAMQTRATVQSPVLKFEESINFNQRGEITESDEEEQVEALDEGDILMTMVKQLNKLTDGNLHTTQTEKIIVEHRKR